MENLLGDNIVSKSKKEKGVEKNIYFATIDCQEFEQLAFDGKNRKLSLKKILNDGFDISNSNYDSKNGYFLFNCDGKNYAIQLIDNNVNYLFGQISTEKEYQDILEEYKSGDNKTIKSIIIKSFTFFYIDINKKNLVYIGHKNLKNINKIFTKYFEQYSNVSLTITFYGDNDLIKKIEKSTKLKSIDFQVADTGDVAKSLDKTLAWDRDINSYSINIKIKKPTKKFLLSMILDKNKFGKISKPVIKFQDETFNDYISHLFENYFTIKDVIYISQIDLDGFTSIKEKLIKASKKFME